MLEISKKYLAVEPSDLKFSDIEKLTKVLAYHSDLYYNKEAPVISDFEYDSLLKQLEYLEKKYGVVEKYSETVGAEIQESTFAKVAHSRPMISLGNTYNAEDLRDFDIRVYKNLTPSSSSSVERGASGTISYMMEYKFDGLGIELIYKNGVFTQAITRGNGQVGEDVTQNVLQIANIPKKIPYTQHLEVRGEVVMPISEFERINKENLKNGEKVFSNPRNAASGSLRTKDITVTRERKLKFFAYDLANFGDFIENLTPPNLPLSRGGIEEGGQLAILEKELNRGNGSFQERKTTYHDVIQSLHSLGFDISSYFKIFQNIEDIITEIENMEDYKKNIDFEVDGLVLKVNDIDLWEQIGWTEHHPRYAIAYKFPAEVFTTTVISVDHQVGRTGTITPVANLDPVVIGGVTVKRATLHNYEEVENLGLSIGDTVFIKRAGEVIPKIISVAAKGENTTFIGIPKLCPSCESEVQKDSDKVRYYCSNSSECPAQNYEQLVFAVGKQGFNIDGLGKNQIRLFLELGLIKNLVDIFYLSEKQEEILNLEGYREKSVKNMMVSIENAKKIDIIAFLTALGISGVGKKTAKNIAHLFPHKNNLLDFSYSLEELESISDIGPEIAKNIFEYFTNGRYKHLLGELADILDIQYFQEKTTSLVSTYFSGKKVCITGSFIKDGEKISRDILVKALELAGGNFVSSVSKNTDILLAGEKAGSKLKKANELGVEVMNLEEFEEKLS